MALRKKKQVKFLKQVRDTLKSEFGNRIVSITCVKAPKQWVSSHAQAEVRAVVKRNNVDLTNTIYDVVYKMMYKNNFRYLVSLRVEEEVGNEAQRSTKTIKGKIAYRQTTGRGMSLWKVV